MRGDPPQSQVAWPEARRIISSRYPPVDLFEDIADPRDWELIASAEAKTNPRVLTQFGRLDLVPPERRVSGPGASHVMAPFVHVSPDRPGRFHDGTFGAYYAARHFGTAVAETAWHKSLFYRATEEAPGWFCQMRELVGAVDALLHDLRGQRDFDSCLLPTDYTASQNLARTLREGRSDGLVYPSVRDEGGECVAAFWPDVVALPVQGRHLAYHFDGQRIDLVRDENGGDIWRLD
jgi:RES domain-containing protein